MSQNCNIEVRDADGSTKAVLYSHDNILFACIEEIVIKASKLAVLNARQLSHKINAKKFAALIVVAAWECQQLIVPDTAIHEDVDFHVDVLVESIERIVLSIRSCERHFEDMTAIIDPTKLIDNQPVHASAP